MRIIKRTKITVIRTETVYLQKHDTEMFAEFSPLQINRTEENKQGSVIGIEAIREPDNIKEGETK